MMTEEEIATVVTAKIEGADIERIMKHFHADGSWEAAPLPIEWNFVDFDFRVAEPEPVSAYQEFKLNRGPGLHKDVDLWNAAIDAFADKELAGMSLYERRELLHEG